jgi:hypothetical protein
LNRVVKLQGGLPFSPVDLDKEVSIYLELISKQKTASWGRPPIADGKRLI